MTAKEQELFDALMKFHDNDMKKVHNVIIKLVQSNDLSPETGEEMYSLLNDEPEVETRAKTVRPEPKMSDPAQYDSCGNIMTADEVERQRIAQEEWKRKKKEKESQRAATLGRSRNYDPCGGGIPASC
jgi:hypothetical protein